MLQYVRGKQFRYNTKDMDFPRPIKQAAFKEVNL